MTMRIKKIITVVFVLLLVIFVVPIVFTNVIWLLAQPFRPPVSVGPKDWTIISTNDGSISLHYELRSMRFDYIREFGPDWNTYFQGRVLLKQKGLVIDLGPFDVFEISSAGSKIGDHFFLDYNPPSALAWYLPSQKKIIIFDYYYDSYLWWKYDLKNSIPGVSTITQGNLKSPDSNESVEIFNGFVHNGILDADTRFADIIPMNIKKNEV